MCASLILSWISVLGLVGAQTNVVTIVISSSPAGSNFVLVDGGAVITPATFSWTVGSNHTLWAVPIVAGPPGVRYVFIGRWSDGGIQMHTYTVPSSSQTVTANYTAQYLFTVIYNPSSGGFVWLSGLHISGSGIANAGVPSGTSEWADAGSTISLYAYTNPGYDLSGWSTTGSITYIPQTAPLATATVDGPGTITANFQAQPAGSSGAIAVGFQALASDGVGFPVILGNVSVDGTPLSTKWEYGSTPDWAAGSVHTLSALSPVYGGNLRWIFVGWSDGGLQTHSYVVPGKQSG